MCFWVVLVGSWSMVNIFGVYQAYYNLFDHLLDRFPARILALVGSLDIWRSIRQWIFPSSSARRLVSHISRLVHEIALNDLLAAHSDRETLHWRRLWFSVCPLHCHSRPILPTPPGFGHRNIIKSSAISWPRFSNHLRAAAVLHWMFLGDSHYCIYLNWLLCYPCTVHANPRCTCQEEACPN